MDGKDKSEPKVKLDNDDILAELGLANDKAEIDSEGLIEKEEFIDNAVLDKEGILNEEAPAELEIAEKKNPEKVTEKKEEPAALKNALGYKLNVYLEKIKSKKLPWIKISVLAGAAGALCLLVCILLIFLIFPKAPQEDVKEAKTPQGDTIKEEPQEEKVGIDIDLEPFIIPVQDNRKQTSFLRISVHLNVNCNVTNELKKEAKNIRTTIYNLIRNTGAQDILDEEKRAIVALEIQKLLNTLINKEAIQHVTLTNILLV
ncbi:MAG: flagellar basal body-associated FliL family protein [Pseudomonadota bacterium]